MNVRFSVEDAERAAEEWGANCGPGAIAGILGLTLDEVRPHLLGFETRRYMNLMHVYAALRSLGRAWYMRPPAEWPDLGLVRVQWEGPWMDPGVPERARYRYTHFIGARRLGGVVEVFDINAIAAGGWLPLLTWAEHLVPWLLKQIARRNNGKWHKTHVLEVV